MLGQIDAFDFILAQDLGMSLGQVRALPNAEIVQWQAFYAMRHAMQNMTERVQRGRR